MEGQPFIKVEGITKSFPGVKALKGVSFDVRPGEVHALCGENGAGKSTLIKVLTGVHKKDGGRYFINGSEVFPENAWQTIELGVACIYQELSIVPQLDVANNLFLGNLPQKKFFVDKKALYEKAGTILRTIRLNISARRIAGELSVAQQQMIEIGRALTRNAKIIIMDEPTSSLSDKEAEVLFSVIETLKKDGVAIIYISHKLDEVLRISDRITVIRDGENIITKPASECTRDELIAHMIGRSLENLYNKKTHTCEEPVLEVKGLCRAGVFEDISFTVHGGEVLGFFGLVGAGRTEIMKAVFGMGALDGGEVLVEGKVISPDPHKAIKSGIGFVSEDRKAEGLALSLSIAENITFVKLSDISKLGVIDKKSRDALTSEYIKRMRIKTPSARQRAVNLSGGNQQKIVIAKWLMMAPSILILDEPTRGIDVGSKSEIYQIINDLAEQGVAIIVVSSELPEILGVCDRVITIFEGKKTGDMYTEGLTDKEVLSAALGGAV